MIDAEIKAAEAALLARESEIGVSMAKVKANEDIMAEHARSAERGIDAIRLSEKTQGFYNPTHNTFAGLGDTKVAEGDIDDDFVSEKSSFFGTRETTDNRAIVKQCLKKLFGNNLKTNELGKTLDFSRKIQRLHKFGGTECPLNFMSDARVAALSKFVCAKHGVKKEAFRESYTPLSMHADTFVRHLTEAAITSRGLTEGRYLDHCKMAKATVFSFENIENYLTAVELDIESLPPMSDRSKVKQILEGLQPWKFQELILKKYSWVLSAGIVEGPGGILDIIQTECQQEQLVTDKLSEGYGVASKGGGNGGNGGSGGGSNGGGTSGGNGNNTNRGGRDDIKGGRSTYTRKCFNCDGDHRISECPELCRKCVPSCGKKSQECPVYLKFKAAAQTKGSERTTFLNRTYSSNNAKVQKKAQQSTARKSAVSLYESRINLHFNDITDDISSSRSARRHQHPTAIATAARSLTDRKKS